ncbi:hypothetical protein ACFL09_05350 [Planctomycetota bacterium]
MDTPAKLQRLKDVNEAVSEVSSLCEELADLLTVEGELEFLRQHVDIGSWDPTVADFARVMELLTPKDEAKARVADMVRTVGKQPSLEQQRASLRARLAERLRKLGKDLTGCGVDARLAERVRARLLSAATAGTPLDKQGASLIREAFTAMADGLRELAAPVSDLLASGEGRWALQYPWPPIPTGKWLSSEQQSACDTERWNFDCDVSKRVQEARDDLIAGLARMVDDTRAALASIDEGGAQPAGSEAGSLDVDAQQPDPKIADGFRFSHGLAWYGDRELALPAGLPVDVLTKLVEMAGLPVRHLELHPYSSETEGSDQLRAAITLIRSAFRATRVPREVESVRSVGYRLVLK